MQNSDEKRLERIEAKLDDVSDHLGSIDATLSAQHVSLREHMRRTAILEAEIKPLKTHMDMVKGVAKFISMAAAVAAILEVMILYFHL